MDSVFGKANFRNEIVWRKYSGRKSNAKRKFPTQQDTILFYAASANATFSPVYLPFSEKEILRSTDTLTATAADIVLLGDANINSQASSAKFT